MLRRTTIGCLVALVLVGACSSGGSAKPNAGKATSTTRPDPKAGWDTRALATIDGVVARIKHAFPRACADALPLPHADYVNTAKIIHSDVPLAVSDCNGLGETLEISAFADAKTRAAWVTQRTGILCARAKKGKFDLDGVHWVVDGNWSIQPDTEGVGHELTTGLGATYQANMCPWHTQIDWEPAAVARVQQVRTMLEKQPRVRCENFQLLDRSEYSHNQQYANRLPAAYARCGAPGGAVIWIAGFSPRSVGRDLFLATETKGLCASAAGIQAVRGTDWGIIANQVNVASLAAVATGGTALPAAC